MNAHLTARRAALDAHRAAAGWVQRQPALQQNSPALQWSGVERAVLAAVGDAGERDPAERLVGQSYLLVPAIGRQLVIGPDTPDLDDAIRQVASRDANCDLCSSPSVAGWLPMPVPPQVVALTLCARCVGDLDRAIQPLHFVLADRVPDHPEEN